MHKIGPIGAMFLAWLSAGLAVGCRSKVDATSSENGAVGETPLPPGTFSITAPPVAGNLSAPSVIWTESKDATSFDVKIAKAAGCQEPVQSYDDVIGTTQPLTPLDDGDYVACVTAKKTDDGFVSTTAADNDGYAFSIDTQPPAAFNLKAFDAPLGSMTPKITWSASAGASAYDLVVSKAKSCESALQTHRGITGTSKTLTVLPNGTYYACLTAVDRYGNSTTASNSPLAFKVAVAGPQLEISGPDSPATYTCQVYSVTARNPDGTVLKVAGSKSVGLSGLGAASAYASLNTCRSGSPAITSVAIADGQSAAAFYVRSSTAESLTLRAVTDGLGAGELPISVVLFQVLGQSSATRNAGLEQGTDYPRPIFVVGGRMFVSDFQNNRVLVWNAIPTTSGDQPDYVIGQTSLSTNRPNAGGSTSAFGLHRPMGIYSDGTKLYVVDYGNNRVLGWNTIPTSSGVPADFALGQPDLVTKTAHTGGLSGSSMYGPFGVHGDGTHLIVTDSINNRALVWNTLPTASGQSANFALGQPDLVSNTANNGGLSASTLNYPTGVFTDGTQVVIGDLYNNRVLVWNTFPTASGQAASFALGQPDLTSGTANNGGVSATSLNGPTAVLSDGTRLIVCDDYNHRVLVWNAMPTANGQAASFALGQPDLMSNTANNGGVSASSLKNPDGIYIDGTRLFISDMSNNRIMGWTTMPSVSGQAANLVLGQPDFVSIRYNNDLISAATMRAPWDIYSDGTRLFVVEYSGHRVLMWNSLPTSNQQPADIVLGQPDAVSETANNGGVTGSSMDTPGGVYSDGVKLYVVDSGNNRVLVWNTMPTVTGKAADFALGQPDLTSNALGATASSFNYPYTVTSDGTRLFVADYTNNRVLVWNAMPTTFAEPASFALGQPDLTTVSGNTSGLSNKSLYRPGGVGTDGESLVVADTGNHRVLIFNQLPSADFEKADVVLGQQNFASNTANNGGVSASSLWFPYKAVLNDGQLIVSDYNNSRLLMWNSLPSADAQAADVVFGQPDFTSNSANNGGLGANGLSYPGGVFSDGLRVMIADYANDRILIIPRTGL